MKDGCTHLVHFINTYMYITLSICPAPPISNLFLPLWRCVKMIKNGTLILLFLISFKAIKLNLCCAENCNGPEKEIQNGTSYQHLRSNPGQLESLPGGVRFARLELAYSC